MNVKPTIPTTTEVDKLLAAHRRTQNLAERAREILQAATDRAAEGARTQAQFNALADILDDFAAGYRRLADLAHRLEAGGSGAKRG